MICVKNLSQYRCRCPSLIFIAYSKIILINCCNQGIVYQLDIALEDVKTQKCGLVFIYDMSDSKYSNFDYELSQKILTLLKVSSLKILFNKLTIMMNLNHVQNIILFII